MRITLAALALVLSGITPVLANTPKVVASLKPIHSLVAAVMGETGSPELLVTGAASPHTFSLKPSQAASLTEADLIFWVDPALEGFLVSPMANLAKENASVPLLNTEGVTLLEAREGGIWESHDEDDHHGHEHGHADEHQDVHEEETDHQMIDPHFWLDIGNGVALVTTIEHQLSKVYPDLAPVFAENASAFRDQLLLLDTELKEQLAPVSTQPYIVFHDAYQYFEERYDLSPAGSVTANPEVRPGARRIADLRQASSTAICVFAEPQFEARILQRLTEDEDVHLGYLDPLGSALPAGPDHYAATLRALANSITDCLSQ
ncbi:zinc ABC transporter substrate-binding protein [Parvibaculaceae bacterium PLY_AMNH_Bact1]|nr:zinc ABC transporter substrate-binding protein [Parvibaculaceae bacterium PLY_AMNH_Bact1]